MRELFLEGVRCFRDEQRIPIRPITLLVGENSSGKSTVLSMIRAAWDVAFKGAEPDFNEKPFTMGGYDAIAHYHGGQGKRVSEFKIKSITELPRLRGRETTKREVVGTFSERGGQPALTEWSVRQGELFLSIVALPDARAKARVELGKELALEDVVIEMERGIHFPQDAFFSVRRRLFEKFAGAKAPAGKQFEVLESVSDVLPGAALLRRFPRPIAGAPIRSRPQRTYNPERDLPEPEGSHVPMGLAALSAAGPEQFRLLAERLARYGSAAGLFSKLEVKRLGKKAGDPFQLLVAVEKFPFNLLDVGYGVSQVLPIVVDALTAPEGQTFLLQQPEVHLHPRAQAAFGSLLVEQAADRRQTFIVETHSDYLVDRVRMDVRAKKGRAGLRPEDVVIIFFERDRGRVNIHPIEIDNTGSLVNVPSGYRRFFLDEERRLLGLGSN